MPSYTGYVRIYEYMDIQGWAFQSGLREQHARVALPKVRRAHRVLRVAGAAFPQDPKPVGLGLRVQDFSLCVEAEGLGLMQPGVRRRLMPRCILHVLPPSRRRGMSRRW